MSIVITTLTNGKRVANFSSPHPFTFEDGTVLPGVSNETAEQFKVTFNETDLGRGDIRLSFDLSSDVKTRMSLFMQLWNDDRVDVVFCPLPMIKALKDCGDIPYRKNHKLHPFRAIRMEDRINKRVSISKQCI